MVDYYPLENQGPTWQEREAAEKKKLNEMADVMIEPNTAEDIWGAADNWWEDPLFDKGLGQFFKTVGKDYWNTAMGTIGGLADFVPGLNILNPGEFFYNRMFKDEDRMKSDPTFDVFDDRQSEYFKNHPELGPLFQDMMEEGDVSEDEAMLMFEMSPFLDPNATWMDKIRAGVDVAPHMLKMFANELFQPSLVDDLNPYAEGFGKARMWANILPQAVNIYATRGTGSPIMGLTTLMNKLSPKMRSAVQQTLPVTTGAPKKWSKFLRNMALQTPTNPMFPFSVNLRNNAAEAATISNNVATTPGASREDYRWSRLNRRPVKNIEIELGGQNIDRWPDHPGR